MFTYQTPTRHALLATYIFAQFVPFCQRLKNTNTDFLTTRRLYRVHNFGRRVYSAVEAAGRSVGRSVGRTVGWLGQVAATVFGANVS